MKKFSILLLLTVLLAACSDQLVKPALVNTKWKLTEWPGKTVPTVADATLEFKADSNVAGKSFCNGYGGSYVLNNNQIKFGPLFGTKMYCEAVGMAESDFLKDMDLVNTAAIKDGKLYLSQDDKTLLIFTKSE